MHNDDPRSGLEFAGHGTGHDSLSGRSDKKLLGSVRWHGPYSEALMETDPRRRARWIAESEREIFAHYIELCAAPGPAECSADMDNATKVLRALKNRTKIPRVVD